MDHPIFLGAVNQFLGFKYVIFGKLKFYNNIHDFHHNHKITKHRVRKGPNHKEEGH